MVEFESTKYQGKGAEIGKESYLRNGDTMYRMWCKKEMEKGNNMYRVVSGQWWFCTQRNYTWW